jgi:hypothetical protein
MAKQIIPAVRVTVTKQLYTRHNFNQERIAEKLGITQAAVSKYLSGKYTQQIKQLEKDKIVGEIADEIVGAIIRKTFDKSSFERCVCNFCGKILRRSNGV